MKKIMVFGATGSIGLQTINIIKQDSNLQLCAFTYLNNESLANEIKTQFPQAIMFCHKNPNDEWQRIIQKTQPDLVVNSITGFAGLAITQYCIENNYKLALANKESLVVAGHLIDCSKILPIDSEHSALYELVQKYGINDLNTLYLTASGGAFYNLKRNELTGISFNQAITHPTWKMGYKISIDSATLVNKCFEIIEAYHFFKIKNIVALYHPTSIVHGLIKTNNGAIISYMSYPDMKLPISLALNDYSISSKQIISDLNLSNLNLYFEQISPEKFIPLKWANDLINSNNYAIGTIITVVDDYVIELFKNNKISFLNITDIIDNYINKYQHYKVSSWNDIYNLREAILLDLRANYK